MQNNTTTTQPPQKKGWHKVLFFVDIFARSAKQQQWPGGEQGVNYKQAELPIKFVQFSKFTSQLRNTHRKFKIHSRSKRFHSLFSLLFQHVEKYFEIFYGIASTCLPSVLTSAWEKTPLANRWCCNSKAYCYSWLLIPRHLSIQEIPILCRNQDGGNRNEIWLKF